MNTKSIEEFIAEREIEFNEKYLGLILYGIEGKDKNVSTEVRNFLRSSLQALLVHLEKEVVAAVTSCKSPDQEYTPDKLHEAKTIYRIDAIDAVRALLYVPSPKKYDHICSTPADGKYPGNIGHGSIEGVCGCECHRNPEKMEKSK